MIVDPNLKVYQFKNISQSKKNDKHCNQQLNIHQPEFQDNPQNKSIAASNPQENFEHFVFKYKLFDDYGVFNLYTFVKQF